MASSFRLKAFSSVVVIQSLIFALISCSSSDFSGKSGSKSPAAATATPTPGPPGDSNLIPGTTITKAITIFFEDTFDGTPGTMMDISACITGDFVYNETEKSIVANSDVELDVQVFNAQGNACPHTIVVEQYRNNALVGTPITLKTTSVGAQIQDKLPLQKNDYLKVGWSSPHKTCNTYGSYIYHTYKAADGVRPLPRFVLDSCKGQEFPTN